MNKQRKSSPNHGGARPGAGRPKGSGVKIRVEDLMLDMETELGLPYTQRVARNYVQAISREDWARVENYDRALLNKLVADRTEVEVVESEDTVAAKARGFQEALAKLVSSQVSTK
jgi:hypothetical protein